MDDLIYRQDAINEFSYCQTYLFDSIDRDPKISLEDAKYAIEHLPSAQQWIPCSERLPKRKDETQMRGYYLTTNAYGSVGLTKYEFEGGGLGYAWDSDIRIVAWMPLPEPYEDKHED